MSGVIERVEEFLKSEMWKEKEPGFDDVDMSFNNKIDEQKRDRLIHGEKNHGVLDLDTDPRDFLKEGVEELIDFLNYIEFAMLQGKVSFCKWFFLDKDVRFLIWRLEGKSEGLLDRERGCNSLPCLCEDDLQAVMGEGDPGL